MGLSDKPAFTAGELDPALWERTNLDKYRNGLATARNWIISKTGSILTRQSRQYAWQTKLLDNAVIMYSPPGGGVIFEWGHQYVRIYSLSTFALLFDLPHNFTVNDLPNINFETTGSYVYIFCAGKTLLKLNYATGAFIDPTQIFLIPPTPTTATATYTASGYKVEYCFTFVINGEESQPYFLAGQALLPEATSEFVNLSCVPGVITFGSPWQPYDWSEMRVYRRPYNTTDSIGAGAYGYIGSSTSFAHSVHGPVTKAFFTDLGGDADFTHQPPAPLLSNTFNSAGTPGITDPGTLLSNTGITYQQRLLITDFVTDLQAIYASQPGYQDNFYRNFPLDAASALKFKCGTSGYARVLRMLDSDGLVVFTSAGIYLNQGDLEPDNIGMTKKGKWIINPSLPPLPVPGGVIFLDASTNGVRNLLWSFQLNAFDADEVSIYSNHLFRSRQMNSWGFQQGFFPLLWAVFTDGGYAGFTFDYNQQMQAWTRHDGVLPAQHVAPTTNADQTFFVVKKNDPNSGHVVRYVEFTIPRYVSPSDVANDPDYDKGSSCAFMDGMVSVVNRIAPLGTTPFTFAPTVFNDSTEQNSPDWSQPLNLDCGTLGLFTGLAAQVGAIYRFFDEDESAIDVIVLSITDSSHVQVQINNSDVFPSEWATGATLYCTFTQLNGLTMFEQEFPAIVGDGSVICSPNNDQENYPELQVVNGSLTLPSPMAIVHIGRPIVADVQTLNIDTVEEAPTLIESIVVNKVYVAVKDSKGLFIGSSFPKDNGVSNMVELDSMPVDYTQDDPIIGNRAQPAQTKRFEIVPLGDWSKQGRIAVRQVDPLHAEILSFIPDVEVETRSDR